MSCKKCGNSNTNCGCKDTAYTTVKTYTCPPDSACPTPLKCSEFFDAACIFMTDGVADAGIRPGSSLESIIQQLIMLVTNPGCVDAPGGVPGGGTVNFVDAVWPGNAIIIDGGPIQNSGTFVFNGQGNSSQYIDGQGNLQTFPSIPAAVEFQTNGTPNDLQDLLNLVAGTGVTLTNTGGSVTIDVDAKIYTAQNGLSEQPADSGNFELGAPTSPGAPLLHDTYVAGAQYAFEINNTSSMFLQGNRVDIEGADPGVKVLSTGGASDNSIEVTGTQVAIESVGGGATRIFLDPAMIKIQTPLFNTKNNNDVLTLIDKTTGEVEFMPPASILLQTDGTDNADQTYLNLISGNGIVLTNVAGDVTIDGPTFQTDGTDNSTQTLLNLVAGTGITLSESGGSVTIDASAPAINLTTIGTSGTADYNPLTGDLNIPEYQAQIDVQDEGVSKVINPTIMNFVGQGVTVTNSGSEATITIPGGGGPGNIDADNGLLYNLTDPNNPIVQLGGPDTAPAPLIRNTYITTAGPLGEYDFDISGIRAAKPIINVTNTGQGTAIKGNTSGGFAIYGVTASGFSGYFEADSSLIGLYSVNKTGNLSAEFESVSSINSTVIPVVRVMRTVNISNPGINGANGIGAAVDFFLEDNNNIAAQAGALSYEFTSAATGAVVSKFAVTTANSSTVSRKLEITGAGQLILNNYTTSTSFDPESGASVGVLNVDNTGKVFVTTGGGGPSLAVEVNGTPLSSSTLLNFIPSSDIAFTDLGGGQLSLSLVNPPVTYDSNEGVYNDTDIFKLGAPSEAIATSDIPLQVTRWIDTQTKSLRFFGTTDLVEGGVLWAEGKSSGAGLFARNITGIGSAIEALQNEYTAVRATTYNGVAVAARVTQVTDPVSGIPISAYSEYGSPAGIAPMIVIERSLSSLLGSPPANGIGSEIRFDTAVNTAPITVATSNKIISKWTNVTSATRTSQFEIHGANAANIQTQFTILGGGTSGPAGAWSLTPGQIKFDRYAGGAIYKSANDLSTNSGFNLGIDANGNIWATDFSTTTGPVTGVSNISIGTLSNGASATVNNPSGPSATIDITGQNAYTQIQADSGTAQNATVYNEAFKIVGAQGITTSIASPSNLDTVTINGPNKYLNFQLKDSGNNNITGGTYTPAAWNSTLNIRAGAGVQLSNDTANANTLIISATGAPTTGVTSVSGTNANGFTLTITNPTTTPNITIGTSVTGILVGDGSGGITSVSTTGGSGVLTYDSTTNSYSYTTLPTVNDGAIVLGATADLTSTNTTVTLQNNLGGPFTANKADNSTYRAAVGPALKDYAAKMTGNLPAGSLPQYLTKSTQDVIALATPVTTFSPGTTGFTISNGVASNVTTALTGPVVLGGVLGVTSGGTGNTTAPGNGQLLVGDGNGGFTVTNISGSGAINVTSGPGGIIISTPGLTANVKNGLYINADGSIRLGSGPNNVGGTAQFPDSMLIEQTVIRMNSQNYRLADGTNQTIEDVGFDINDGSTQKTSYLGTSTKGFWFSAATGQAAAPSANFQGFIWGGQTTNAFGTTMGGFFHRAAGAAAFPTTFSGFANDVPNGRLVTGYIGPTSGVYEIVNRTNNFINQHGLWGGTGGTVDFLMYQANATSKLISFGDVSLLGNGTRFQVNDASGQYRFNTGTIYAAGYGGATPVGQDIGQVAKYTLATSSNGKLYEIQAVSIGSIAVTGSGTYTPTTLAATGALNTLTVVGTGSVGVTLAGSTLTINGTGGGPAIPYWKTLSFGVFAGTTGQINNSNTGTATIDPNAASGPNTLNIQAGDNINIRTNDTGDLFAISANFTPPNSWGNITFSANGGSATPAGGLVLQPDSVSDGLGIVAGAGIAIAVSGGGAGTTADSFTITNSGVLGLTLNATLDAFSITGTANNPILAIPFRWRAFTVTNGSTVPAASSGALQPTLAADSLNFNAGPGIQLKTESLTKTVHISATAAATNSWGDITFTGNSTPAVQGGSLVLQPDAVSDGLGISAGTGIGITVTAGGAAAGGDAFSIRNTGVVTLASGGTPSTATPGTSMGSNVSLVPGAGIVFNNTIGIGGNPSFIEITAPGSFAPTASEGLITQVINGVTDIQLGSTSLGGSFITVDRYIGTQTKSIFLNGTPAAGVANMQITSTGVGRALKLINSNTIADGALYAIAPVDASTDSAPNGTIYAQNTAKGHAVVGVSNGADSQAQSGVFGSGRQGVKGYSTVAGGIGVYGHSQTGLGIGVQGEAVGGAATSFAGLFSISNTTAAKQEVIKLSKAASGVGEGATIGFYGGANKKGQIGYVSDQITTSSQYEVSVVNSGNELVKHKILSTGQHRFHSYGATTAALPAPSATGNRALVVNTSDANQGTIYELDFGGNSYTITGITVTPTTLGSVSAPTNNYTVIGKVVTLTGTLNFTFTNSAAADARTFALSLPLPYSQNGNLIASFKTFRSTTYFSLVAYNTTGGTLNIILTNDVTIPAGFANALGFIFTYITT